MVRASPQTNSFASGELSSLMHAREDYARFQNGMRKCRGFMTIPEGAATRLPGTKFLGNTHGDLPARLMRFAFKDEDAMLLEWTSGNLRFWRNSELVQASGSSDPYRLTVPYAYEDAKRLQSLVSSDRVYLAEGVHAPQRLSRLAIDNWTIEDTPFENGPFSPRNIDQAKELSVSEVFGTITVTSSFDLFSAGHIGVLFKLSEVDTSETPYWSADIATVTGDQYYYNGRVYRIAGFDQANGTTSTVAPDVTGVGEPVTSHGIVQWSSIGSDNSANHPAWEPSQIVKIGDRRWTGAYVLEVTGFAVSNRKTGTNPPVHTDGLWLSEKSGPVYEYLHDGSGTFRITSVEDERTATAEVVSRLPSGLVNSGTYRWSEQAWSSMKGWPRAIGAYKQRHVYGRTPDEPRTIWHSVIGGTTDMSAAGGDDEGFSYILDSDRRDNGEINWIVGAGGVLHVGTTSGEFIGSSTDADRAYSEETASYDNDTDIGCADRSPVVISGKVVFLDKTGKRMLTLLLDQEGRFDGEPLTQISRHILSPECLKLVYQATPIPIIWGVLANGDLVGCTYILKSQVLGFHKHNLAAGHVVDVEVMPSDDGKTEVLELVVSRTIGGQVRNFREQMLHPFVDLDGDDPELADAWHLFAAKRYEGPATDIITGLEHLEGEAVVAWTEYGAVTDLVVESGAVTLPREAASAIVGLDASNDQVAETLDMRVGTPDGGDTGRVRSHRATGIHLHRTSGGTISVVQTVDGVEKSSDPERIIVPTFEEPVSLKTGVFDVPGHKGFGAQSYLRFKPEPGAPMTILSKTTTAIVSDD